MDQVLAFVVTGHRLSKATTNKKSNFLDTFSKIYDCATNVQKCSKSQETMTVKLFTRANKRLIINIMIG